MPTWDELKAFAREQYTLDDDTEEGFSLVWELEGERTQKIGVSHFNAFEKDWIELRSYVCKEAEMEPKVAVRKNDELAIGALALDDDGDYCLVYSLALDTLDMEELELPLQVIAAIADELEENYSGADTF